MSAKHGSKRGICSRISGPQAEEQTTFRGIHAETGSSSLRSSGGNFALLHPQHRFLRLGVQR